MRNFYFSLLLVISGTGNSAITNIFLNGEMLGTSTTVAQFSKLVVDNNADFQYGLNIIITFVVGNTKNSSHYEKRQENM